MSEPPPFVHLHARSHYSLLSSPAAVKDLVAAAAADGQPALALCDNGNLFGAIEFYKACGKAGIKPILGQTTYVARQSSKDPARGDNPTHDLTLLAADEQGFDNLKKLSGRAWLEGFSYRPRADLEMLSEHRQGLVALSGTLSSAIASAILQDDLAGARATAGRLRELFGRDGFFLEVAETGCEPQRKVTAALRRLSAELDIPCVATNDVHYLKPADWPAHDILPCIRSGKPVADQTRFRMSSRELYL